MALSSTAVPKIGVMSGSGPEAGLNVFKQLLDKNRSRKGSTYKTDKDAPFIAMLQVPGIGGPHGLWDVGDRNSKEFAFLWENIKQTVSSMQKLDVDCFCLTCNTLHVLEPDIREYMTSVLDWDQSKFTSIVDCTGLEILHKLEDLIQIENKHNGTLKSVTSALTSAGTPSLNDQTETCGHSDTADRGDENDNNENSIITTPNENSTTNAPRSPSKPEGSLTTSAATAILGTFLSSDPVESPYRGLSKHEQLHLVEQPLEFRNKMQQLIIDVKKFGPIADLSAQFLLLVKDMREIMKKNNDECYYFVMVLACSELPMLLDLQIGTYLREHNIQVVDPNSALCDALLNCEV